MNICICRRPSQPKGAKTVNMSLSAINRWHRMHVKTGNLKDRFPKRSFKKLDPDKLRAYMQEHPDACLKETGEAFNCSDTGILKAFRRLGITRKKTKPYREPKAEKIAEYLSEIIRIPAEQIAYVDETGIDTRLHREGGWSEGGKLFIGKVHGRKY